MCVDICTFKYIHRCTYKCIHIYIYIYYIYILYMYRYNKKIYGKRLKLLPQEY